ncbi:unnamed protein product [Rotaria magnacalcarata]|uniref:Uncharacterized protein n=1 Tax=Rotaria magnacalcarata TaxID=392030 RepID=A0A820DJE1_9BILA|nr:unnamed protein product [Rotaria magnacalcarata]CAF4232841.1 unnamed protein product [Rotaria magnacalcarata]CAF5072430.1 unnamed protein product [Rotaria magnacalcarata]CAF5158173.1 unnamed protein product [Rotaria magnacalcarata]
MTEAFVILTSEIQAKSPAISFINSNKGKPLLVADDYTFKLNKATTTTEIGYALLRIVQLNHLPGKEKLEIREAREKMTYLKKNFLTVKISLSFMQ